MKTASQPAGGKVTVLYIACSSFSGSTLLSMMLNTHPDIATVGHSMGWSFESEEDFRCSCGSPLAECPFWNNMAEAFARNGLPFSFSHFGTRYQLAESERLNWYLTRRLPLVASGTLERLRDKVIRHIPGWSGRLARTDKAYLTLVRTTLEYLGARVYADNSHGPFHLRHLGRIPEFDMKVVYLVRDLHGAIYSKMKNSGRDATTATQMWLREQYDTTRILREFENPLTISYEDLCDHPDETLNKIFAFTGLAPHRFDGDFGAVEHHVLGNMMRLGPTKIVKNVAWREKLTPGDIATIETMAREFTQRHGASPAAGIVRHYLEHN